MALSSRDAISHGLLDDVHASSDLRIRAPKYRFPNGEIAANHASEIAHDEMMRDGNARMNLATFATTWAGPEVHWIADEAMDRSIVDKDECPQTAALASPTFGR
ncbi:MAG: hypothetical protein ACLPYS_04460 [Vulcanimicrobiaceae bacterium]|jgi:glutamate decarboxylase